LRTEDVKIRKKKKVVKEQVRKFEKPLSVFKDWKEDTVFTLSKSLINDIKYWKVYNMIKDEDQYNQIIQILLKYLDKLKHIYIDLISGSEYPLITRVDFWKYADKIK
jgi:hypothetical protein